MPTSVINESAATAFWDAVAATPETLVSDTQKSVEQTGEPGAAFEALTERLQAVHPDLLLIVGQADANSMPEIVVSAGGIKTVFPAVYALVDLAPPAVRERFLVRALRPRSTEGGLGIRYKDNTVIRPEDLRWTATPQRRDPSVVDLVLYVPGYISALPATSSANEDRVSIAFLLLDHLLGEWAVEMQVGAIDFASASDAPGDAADLTALAGYLDRLSAE